MAGEKFEQLKQLAAFNQQNYLVAISNMGTFKRAQKEYPSVSKFVRVEDGSVAVSIGEHSVRLSYDNKSHSCSCPSPVVCVHILMAIMAVDDFLKKQNLTVKAPKSEKETSFDYLKEVSAQDIKTFFSSEICKQATRKFLNSEIAVQEENQLVVRVNGNTVLFMPNSNLEQVVCSCKKNKCEHSCMALMHLSGTSQEFCGSDASFTFQEDAVKLISDCLEFLSGLLQKGAYGATDGDADMAMFYALNLSRHISPLGKYLKTLSSMLRDFSENLVYCDEEKYTVYFCRVVNMLNVCLKNNGNGKVLSKVTESPANVYFHENSDEFLSLGIYPFLAQSGYAGATHVLYSLNYKQLYSVSAVLPTIYADYASEELTQKTLSLMKSEDIFYAGVGKKFKLNNFKRSKSLKITATPDSIISFNAAADFFEYSLLPCYSAVYPEDYSKKVYDYFEIDAQKNFLLLPFDKLSAQSFDELNGELIILLQYGGSERIVLMPYNPSTQFAIDKIEGNELKNGLAFLQSYDGEYRLLTVFLNGGYVDLYAKEKLKK